MIEGIKGKNSYFVPTGNPFVDGRIMKEYSEFFKKVTNFSPYPFQKKIFKHFWVEDNILLKAPTGSGKTWASIAPFIFCWKQWKEGKQNGD